MDVTDASISKKLEKKLSDAVLSSEDLEQVVGGEDAAKGCACGCKEGFYSTCDNDDPNTHGGKG